LGMIPCGGANAGPLRRNSLRAGVRAASIFDYALSADWCTDSTRATQRETCPLIHGLGPKHAREATSSSRYYVVARNTLLGPTHTD